MQKRTSKARGLATILAAIWIAGSTVCLAGLGTDVEAGFVAPGPGKFLTLDQVRELDRLLASYEGKVDVLTKSRQELTLRLQEAREHVAECHDDRRALIADRKAREALEPTRFERRFGPCIGVGVLYEPSSGEAYGGVALSWGYRPY